MGRTRELKINEIFQEENNEEFDDELRKLTSPSSQRFNSLIEYTFNKLCADFANELEFELTITLDEKL